MTTTLPRSRHELLFLLLSGFFITNAILGELLGGKLISFGPFTASIGVLPWPVVFLTTDLVNEYYGPASVRRLTFLTMGLIVYTFFIVFLAINIPAASFSSVTDQAFTEVFGQSLWIIFGSLVAFAISQLVDVWVFYFFKNRTHGKLLWLRATGSTVISQLIDSFAIIGIAFWLPGKIKTEEFLSVASANYSYKLLIAICLTPLIYLSHDLIKRYLFPTPSSSN